jgi:hypothetical protein
MYCKAQATDATGLTHCFQVLSPAIWTEYRDSLSQYAPKVVTGIPAKPLQTLVLIVLDWPADVNRTH